MRTLATLALALVAAPALAQTPGVAARPFEPAPWWMERPILASTGHVWTEVPANRAQVTATYDAIDRDAAAAQRAAADKVRTLGQALAGYGADKVRVETTFRIQPLYDQYRDRQGDVNENQRADKIERYQVVANVAVEIRDIRLTERVYATLMAAKPSSTQPVRFRLQPENETLTQMFRLAVEDAKRRGELATAAAGARLGTVKLIDPTGRACETDVLVTGAGRSYGGDTGAYQVPPPAPPPPPPLPVPPVERRVEDVTVTAARAGQQLDPEAIRLPLNPPLQRLEQKACVIFSLG
ncbi:SIMPL domain-containing protein [Phenylobacterium sp. J426]|uniref:SIMPL domain-containing protein n=1 Tax=Phenylobacterium sp. J426 TaxID=2898439 RepID=UPI002150E844|nr:SIMPL domain-containing protein [Phenylobacterium sp. J426]MCR5875667.1 SIMPL domain-containing protein [Phenylobacterium sp. J426]